MHLPELQALLERRGRWRCWKFVLVFALLMGGAAAAAFVTANRLSPAADTGGTGVPPPAVIRKLP